MPSETPSRSIIDVVEVIGGDDVGDEDDGVEVDAGSGVACPFLRPRQARDSRRM